MAELGSLDAAARSVGISPRTLRRWREQGRRELDALSAEARLVLELDRAEEAGKALEWAETARMLDSEFGRRWAPTGDFD